jgi:CspA family cold shock protein
VVRSAAVVALIAAGLFVIPHVAAMNSRASNGIGLVEKEGHSRSNWQHIPLGNDGSAEASSLVTTTNAGGSSLTINSSDDRNLSSIGPGIPAQAMKGVTMNRERFSSTGTVKFWKTDEGWGVVTVDDKEIDVWVHFSNILMDGYKSLTAGQRVECVYEEPGQDGYDARGVSVQPI